MAISEREREAYELGQEHSKRGLIDVVIASCVSVIAFGSEGLSESEQAAYDKGVNGEQLDGDKD